jgi:hypothetical protein
MASSMAVAHLCSPRSRSAMSEPGSFLVTNVLRAPTFLWFSSADRRLGQEAG